MLSTMLYSACMNIDTIMGSDIEMSSRMGAIVPILFSLICFSILFSVYWPRQVLLYK